MARRHHEGEGGGGGGGARRRIHLVVLLLICVTCGGVYLVCSPVLRNPFEKEVSSLSETKKKTMVVGSLDDKESCCHGAEGTELWGEAVNWGPHLILNSSYQCCTACKANSKCNSWVFCGDRDKCAAKYGEVRKFSSSSSSSFLCFFGISEVLLFLRLLLPFFVFFGLSEVLLFLRLLLLLSSCNSNLENGFFRACGPSSQSWPHQHHQRMKDLSDAGKADCLKLQNVEDWIFFPFLHIEMDMAPPPHPCLQIHSLECQTCKKKLSASLL